MLLRKGNKYSTQRMQVSEKCTRFVYNNILLDGISYGKLALSDVDQSWNALMVQACEVWVGIKLKVLHLECRWIRLVFRLKRKSCRYERDIARRWFACTCNEGKPIGGPFLFLLQTQKFCLIVGPKLTAQLLSRIYLILQELHTSPQPHRFIKDINIH